MSRGRVLLAEDHAPTLRLWRTLIEPEFEVVDTVSDGQSLVEAVDRLSPDVIVSDIAMPGEDGYDLVRRLRHDCHTRSVPAIAVTAYAREEDRARALLAGFERHVPKPIDPAELVRAVADLAPASSNGNGRARTAAAPAPARHDPHPAPPTIPA